MFDSSASNSSMWPRLLSDYGMLLVLALLGGVFSLATYAEQEPQGAEAARQVSAEILRRFPPTSTSATRVLVATTNTPADVAFAQALRTPLTEQGVEVLVVQGEPHDARRELVSLEQRNVPLAAIACQQGTAGKWLVFSNVSADFPKLGNVPVIMARSYRWPNFLKSQNLLNIANQIAVIAIVAIGMTMVIVTGGIDLSVGSLIALSAVVSCLCIRQFAGGVAAGTLGMAGGCLIGILVCGLVGTFSGTMIVLFRIPPFIVTLSMMLMASGLAFRLTAGESVSQVPDSFVWLGRGVDLLGLPNAVVLMLTLYAIAHVVMSRTTLGRYLYAVGGNAEAARLSGVPVSRILLFAYAASGLLAGVGGVVMASLLKSGSPRYGEMYELYTIAAVVVGGTSLSGGEGRMTGTLIGALIIAVLQNGMNLTGIEPYTQKIVLGLVILAAVFLDQLKQRFWNR